MKELIKRFLARPFLRMLSGAFGHQLRVALPILAVVVLIVTLLAWRRVGGAMVAWCWLAPGLVAAAVLAILASLPILGISYGHWWHLALPLVLAALLATLGLLILLSLLPGSGSRGVAARLLSLVMALGLGVYAYAAIAEPLLIEVSRVQIKVPSLPAGSPLLKIVQISDLHIERMTRRDRAMVRLVAQLDPDVLLISGDLTSEYRDAPALDALHEVLAGLHARYGVYTVTGNVDPKGKIAEVAAGTDVRVLENEVARLDWPGSPVYILGLPTASHLSQDRAAFRQLLASAPGDGMLILLYHYPDLFDDARAAGIDLYLAGHTHGGQILLTFIGAPVKSSISNRWYERGWFPWDGGGMYVSRGIGFEGLGIPRVRFLSRPEIASITISSP